MAKAAYFPAGRGSRGALLAECHEGVVGREGRKDGARTNAMQPGRNTPEF